MEVTEVEDAAASKFEGKNWRQARSSFKSKHENNVALRSFLGSQTDAYDVKAQCLELKRTSENKYSQGLGGILENIDALMNLGDVAIKSAPESVGLAWMGVRMCLRGVQGDWATFQLFSGACADIIGIMISCRVYGKLYGGKDHPKGFQELHEKVIEFIPQIYTDILEFSYAVYKYTEKRTIIRIGAHIFKDVKGGFEGQINGIRKSDVKMRDFAKTASDRMIIYLQNENIRGQGEMKSQLVTMQETLDASLKSNEAIVRRLVEELEEESKNTRKKTPYEKAQDRYEENMEHLDPSELQYELLQENLDVHREPDTCLWIFDLKQYKDWYESSKSSMIWVSGEGGYGKSIIMSTVIERLRAQHTDNSKAVVQYFFCKAGTSTTQDTDQILRTITARLYENCLAFPELLEMANAAISKGLGKKDKMSTVDFNFKVACSGLLQAMNRDVFLVIDAIDECVDRQEKQLLQKLQAIIDTASPRIKIMVCSRPNADIAIALHGVANIKCEGNNTVDIKKNVTTQMREFPGWTASEKNHAVEQIVRKSGGQFKFVQIALEFLRKPLIRPFEPTIDGLPNGLDGSYITSWNATNADYRELLKTALTWTLFGDGSVTVPVIMDAYGRTYSREVGIAVEEEREILHETVRGKMNLHEKQIRIAGGQFLEVSSEGNVTLRHLTVKNFFVAKNEILLGDGPKEGSPNEPAIGHRAPWTISAKNGHLEILRVILQNLTSPAFQKKYLFPYGEGGKFSHYTWNDSSEDDDDDDDDYDDDDDDDDDDEEEEGKPGEDGNIIETTNNVVEKTSTVEPVHETLEPHEEKEKEQVKERQTKIILEGDVHESEQSQKQDDKKEVKLALSDSLGQQPLGQIGTDDTKSKTIDANLEADDSDSEIRVQEDNHLYDFDEPMFDSRKFIKYGSSSSENESDYESDDDLAEPEVVSYDSLRYELRNWVHHLREAQALWSAEDQQESTQWKHVWDMLLKFICEQRSAFKAWLRLICYHDGSIPYLRICRGNPLHIASFFGLSSFVRILLEKGYVMDQPCHDQDRFGMGLKGYLAPLDFAVYSKDVDPHTVKLLVDKGADLNRINWALGSYDVQLTPFHMAVSKRPDKEFIEYLLAHNADPSIRDSHGRSAVHYFSYTGCDPDALRLLLEARSDVDLINLPSSRGNQTPLHILVERRNNFPLNLLEAYLKVKADVNIDDEESMRPLHKLALHGNALAVKMLVENGADIHDLDNYGQTALHAAARSGNAQSIEALLERGAEVNLTDEEGRTPLFLACRAHNEETAIFLIQRLHGRPDKEINKSNNNGSTPLREAASQGSVKILRHLLGEINSAAAINTSDHKFEQNSLHKAAAKARRAALELLIEQGGDMSLKDKNGLTPFQLCIRSWAEKRDESIPLEETLSFVIKQKAPPSSELTSLISTAAAKGSVRVIESLIEVGINPRAEDAHGWTPSMIAQHHGQQRIIDLISKQKTSGGKRPSGWADMGQRIIISDDRLKVRPIGPQYYGKTVVSDHPTPATDARYYFEIEIAMDKRATRNPKIDERLVIGVTTLPAILNAACLTRTWDAEEKEYPFKKSYGFSPIQNVLHEFCQGYPSGPRDVKGEIGDVVGCGIDYERKIIFFTNNGRRFEEKYDFTGVSGRFYPAVSIEGRYIAKANFGRKPFRWEGWKAWSMGF